MKYFADSIIQPHIVRQNYRDFCEVGASYGENTDRILEIPSVHVAIVDPCLDTDLELKYAKKKQVKVYKGLSLDVLPKLTQRFDCILIDGDHNWYTVFYELDAISRQGLLKPGGTIFLHDVGWPYGRRDMYYQPETIPAEFLHSYAQKGIVPGQSRLVDEGGANAVRYNAQHSGGPQNGVLTAIEDFAASHPGEYWLATIGEQHGLGVLYRRSTWNQDIGFLILWANIFVLKIAAYVRARKKKIAGAIVLLLVVSLVSRLLTPSKRRR